MKQLSYFRPRSLAEAWRLKEEHGDARFIAGGTDLQIRNWKREQNPVPLISLRGIEGLADIDVGETTTRVGALAPVGDVAEHAALAERYPALVRAAGRLGSAQIRNVATVGGNLCRAAPCADLAPPLLVYEARVRIESAAGAREVAMDDFMTAPGETCMAPGELATAVLLPRPSARAVATFLKKGRVSMDLSLASVAALLEMDGDVCRRARFAAGSVAPTPVRLRTVEALLGGATVTPALIDEAGRAAAVDVTPITDVRTTAAYRLRIVAVFVRRAIQELMG